MYFYKYISFQREKLAIILQLRGRRWALVHFMVLGSRAPWAPNTINICWAPEMSWAPIASKRKFEAMGAQVISGAQQILMVLGAREPRTMKCTKAEFFA